MKKNEQVVNKALPVQVHNPVTCMVSKPIYLLPPPQDTGAIGNCAVRKICSLHFQPEIRSKPVKIHGKNMWIFVSVRKGLEKVWHFSLAFSFGVLHHQPLVLIRVLPKAHDLAAHSPLCNSVSVLPSHCLTVTTMEQIPGISRPLQAEQSSLSWSGQCMSLHIPMWIRLINKIIQVRYGSTHLRVPKETDTAGTTCSPLAT